MPTPVNVIPVACFAPDITDSLLSKYQSLISASMDATLKDKLNGLLACVKAWWDLPESKRADGDEYTTLLKGEEVTYKIVPLEKEAVEKLDSVTPYMDDLNSLSNAAGTGRFDTIPNGDLRNAAFHLLWYCKEITLDREPLTLSKLKK